MEKFFTLTYQNVLIYKIEPDCLISISFSPKKLLNQQILKNDS